MLQNTTNLLGSKKSLYTQKFKVETCAKMWCQMQNTGVVCKSNLGRSPCPLHSCVEDIQDRSIMFALFIGVNARVPL